MVSRRTGIMIAFLMLLSPVTALPVAQVIGQQDMNTKIMANDATETYTSILKHTYFGSSNGTAIAAAPVNFSQRVIGFMAPKGKCAVFSFPVTVASGTLLSIQMTADHPVNFYLMSEFSAGQSANCLLPGNPILTQSNFTDFTLHWTAPANNTFYFVFTGPTAVILLTDQGSAKPIEQATSIAYPTSTQTKIVTYYATTRTSSTVTMTSPLYLHATTRYGLLIIGIIIAILAVSLIGYRRRDH